MVSVSGSAIEQRATVVVHVTCELSFPLGCVEFFRAEEVKITCLSRAALKAPGLARQIHRPTGSAYRRAASLQRYVPRIASIAGRGYGRISLIGEILCIGTLRSGRYRAEQEIRAGQSTYRCAPRMSKPTLRSARMTGNLR